MYNIKTLGWADIPISVRFPVIVMIWKNELDNFTREVVLGNFVFQKLINNS